MQVECSLPLLSLHHLITTFSLSFVPFSLFSSVSFVVLLKPPHPSLLKISCESYKSLGNCTFFVATQI